MTNIKKDWNSATTFAAASALAQEDAMTNNPAYILQVLIHGRWTVEAVYETFAEAAAVHHYNPVNHRVVCNGKIVVRRFRPPNEWDRDTTDTTGHGRWWR